MPLARLFSKRTPGNSVDSKAAPSRSLSNSIRSRMSTSKQPFPEPNSAQAPPPSNPFTSPNSFTSPATRRPDAAQQAQGQASLGGDAPPAYSDPMAEAADDPYAFLINFDTVFLIDDSGSMAGRSWRETSAALAAIAPICTARDKDGVDVHFLNNRIAYPNLTDSAAVERVFNSVRPMGATPTGTRLHQLLKPYLESVQRAQATPNTPEVKPLNIIVITDGVASDDVESVIMQAAKKLEQCDAPMWQVGIQFFQVGQEPGAAEALQELDDDLVAGGCPRDIVDTVPWNKSSQTQGLSADGVLKVVLGSVNRKLDRKKISLEKRR